jgi:hypothetical protein
MRGNIGSESCILRQQETEINHMFHLQRPQHTNYFFLVNVNLTETERMAPCRCAEGLVNCDSQATLETLKTIPQLPTVGLSTLQSPYFGQQFTLQHPMEGPTLPEYGKPPCGRKYRILT